MGHFLKQSYLCYILKRVMEFIYKLIQTFSFSATLEIQHSCSQSELIISHKATK